MVLDEIIVAISGTAAGIITAIVTVWREHRKDIIERYEERADLYKRDHFRKLEEILNREIDRESEIIKGVENGTSKGINTIGTPGVKIMCNNGKIKIDRGLQFIKNKNMLFCHIKSGYVELYNRIVQAEEQEKDYEALIYNSINLIMDELKEIESKIENLRDAESVYKTTGRSIDNDAQKGNYYKSNIIGYIIDDIDFQADCIKTPQGIMADGDDNMILSFSNGKITDKDANLFLSICAEIKKKHSEEIEKIIRMSTDINKMFNGIIAGLSEIVGNLDAGQMLCGKCVLCKKIEDGQKKQMLMPLN
jgi:hypothetical protein